MFYKDGFFNLGFQDKNSQVNKVKNAKQIGNINTNKLSGLRQNIVHFFS